MLTAAEFAKAIQVPYPTVALWLREGRIEGAMRLELGALKVWQIPATAVKMHKGGDARPQRGRPPKPKVDGAEKSPSKPRKRKAQ
jgi:hypothetical protein